MLPFVTTLHDADFVGGALVLVDKPKGWTSFDVVNKIRFLLKYQYGKQKIKTGHSGTLDPMATGLLLICTGSWTKQLHTLQGLDKKYHAEITLGVETDSYDAEGKVIIQNEVPLIDHAMLEELERRFTGEYEQLPPVFSAIKKDGKPLYELARAGKEVKVEPRKVIVHHLDLQLHSPNTIIADIHCGSGYYVRSLAHDIGMRLGCGAHLSALSRLSVGQYVISDAWKMEDIILHFENVKASGRDLQ